ncbi:MAG: hypothetical protein LBQ54_12015 [Planctomycetaceae bacterium]|nr:hypothetical protein [Planctomycetaceae bacterium]
MIRKKEFFFQKRKKLFGMGVLIGWILLLVIFLLVLAARRTPGFYRQWMSVPREKKLDRNDSAVRKSLNLYSHFQTQDTPWQLMLTEEEMNAWLSTSAVNGKESLFTKEFHSPCLRIQGNVIELVAMTEYGNWKGAVHLKFSVTVAEPNQFVLRLRSAKLGVYPLSRKTVLRLLTETLDRKKIRYQNVNESGDVAVKVMWDIPAPKGKKILAESVKTETGQILIEGTIEKG